MLSLLTLFSALGAGLCTGSCTREDLLAPVAVQSPSMLLVTSDSLCARVTVTVSGSSTISSTWPGTSSCTTNLVLIKGTTPKWAGSTRKLSLFIKLTNKSGGALQMRVRLYLPSTGVTVLTPSGTPSSTVVALNPDSSEAGGGRVWFTGGTGTLANNTSTVLDTLLFTLQSPASQVRLSFVATANTSGGGGNPPPLPNSTANVPDDSLHLVADPGDPRTQYYRTIAAVQFSRTASPSQVAALLAKYNAQVVGGDVFTNTYIIMYADPGSTWSAVKAHLRLLDAEPGVMLSIPMTRYEGLPRIETRYPSDGPGLARTDWMAGTGSTLWALRAIRAPQAWGCETGTDGGPRVRVGVMDWGFETSTPDLDSSRTAPIFYATTRHFGQPMSDSIRRLFEFHGISTAGTLTAQGDNIKGVAGSTWRTDLRLYSLGESNAQPGVIDSTNSQIFAFTQALGKAAGDGLRILSLSILLQIAADSEVGAKQHRLLTNSLRDFLNQSPTTLIVKSAGNDSTSRSVQAAIGNKNEALVGALEAVRSEYLGRILIVAGTQPGSQSGGQFWSGSTFVTGGGTDIAAPAKDVAVLGLSTTGVYGGPTPLLKDGTSYAAPMVAGVAAQLIAMDPALTPDSVKHYLLQSAANDIDPNSGVLTPKPNSVNGAPETIYQLDAYGALMQLAWDSPTTPLCGTIMWWDHDSTGVRLNSVRRWDDPFPLLYGLIPGEFLNVSIAQGGRLVAVSNLDVGYGPETWEYAKLNGQWTRTNTYPGITFRSYLERDIADLYSDGWRAVYGKTYPSQTFVDFTSLIRPDSGGALWVQYAPDGLHAIAAGKRLSPCSGTRSFQQAWLVTLPAAGTAASQELITRCGPKTVTAMDAAWDPSGKRFVLTYTTRTAGDSTVTGYYQAFRLNGNGAYWDGSEVALPGRFPGARGGNAEGHTTDATGQMVIFEETLYQSPNYYGAFECDQVGRDATTFGLRFAYGYPLSDFFNRTECQNNVQTTRTRRGTLSLRQ